MDNSVAWLGNTKRFRLPNGLTVLTYNIPSSAAAALHFCVNAGYFCEQDSEVGLAHLLEHMYFKGSGAYPEPGTMGITMKALGGSINATTSYDQTNYFCEIPAERLSPALTIMSDAFVAPLFPADELQRECEVVIEEFNRKLDSPASYSQEKLIQLAFTRHRMKRWRIGTPEQLRSYRREDLFNYFHRYYQPQNMILTITGNFEEKAILERVEELFGSLKGSELKKDLGPDEPSQHELRFASYRAPATTSYLHLGLHGPGVRHPDAPTLEFLAYLLSIGRSARLHRYLVEQKRSASSATCTYAAYEDVGLILFTAITEAEQIRDAGRDIWAVVDDLLLRGIAEDELFKVKNKMRLHQAMQTEDALNLAQLLSYYESYGGYERIAEIYERMERSSAKEILDVASKYLRIENLSVLELTNRNIDSVTPFEYGNRLLTSFAPPESVLSPPMPNEPQKTIGEPQSVSSPQIINDRVTYILHPEATFPFVSGGIFFSGGRNEENDSVAGITHLLFRTILKGTSRWTAEQLAFRFDALGNQPRFGCYRDYSGFIFESLPENFSQIWNLLMECITECNFPEKEVETEKGKMISAIRRNMDDNFVRPMQLFQRAYYGSHPYGLSETGFEESVHSLNQPEILRWKEKVLNGTRVTVVIVGHFNPKTLLPGLGKSLSGLPFTNHHVEPPGYAGAGAQREAVEMRDKKQTAFVLGFPAPAAIQRDVHRYEMLQQILTGMGGRLFLNLRSKKSLAYTVYAGTVSSRYSGTFITYIAGEAAKEQEAVAGMWQELEKLKQDPVRSDELDNACNALIGSYSLNTQTASSRLFDYLNCHMLGRSIPFLPVYRELVRDVTAQDLQEIAQKMFHIENSTIGIVRGSVTQTGAEKVISAEP